MRTTHPKDNGRLGGPHIKSGLGNKKPKLLQTLNAKGRNNHAFILPAILLPYMSFSESSFSCGIIFT